MFLFLNYPSWIHPEIFPGVPFLSAFRWYGLMYILAFGTAFLVLRKVKNEGHLNSQEFIATDDDLFSFIATGIVFLLIGARVFSCLVYDGSDLYKSKPWLIFWPYNEQGQFTGLAGMSYHGGFIGGLFGMIVWAVKHKKPVFQWIDAMVAAIPLGYTFGRIGNFMNGELFGRVTTVPWGMVFPNATPFLASEEWVQECAGKVGMETGDSVFVNLPRHPSQLYEAFFEGLVLWLIIWLCRNHRKWFGMLSSIYMTGYGLFRFFIEYFRQPDEGLGYKFDIYHTTSFWDFSVGQKLCFGMVFGGILLGVCTFFYEKKKGTVLVNGKLVVSKSKKAKAR